ncbi:MAG: PIN domain-containing protein [Promethearchaeia archaeon]
MTYVLDSNFLFALTFEKDKHFNRAYEMLTQLKEKNISSLITNNLVLQETMTLVIARFNGSTFHLDKISKLFWGENNFFQIAYLMEKEYKKICEILTQYSSEKRLLSSVDASLIYLFKKFNAKKIISFDSHFDNIIPRIF